MLEIEKPIKEKDETEEVDEEVELELYGYECSKCGKTFKITDSPNYCPFCGVERGNAIGDKLIYDGEYFYLAE